MKNTQWLIFLIFILSAGAIPLQAQQGQKDVTGVVSSLTGEPLAGVTIAVKNQPGLGTTTDIDGHFKIKTGAYDVLAVSYIGFISQDIPVSSAKGGVLTIKLEESNAKLDEVVVTAMGKQRKATLVGAITSVDVKSLNVPTSNLSNALAGNIPGIIAYQASGEPGNSYSEFWIRGISTFGANASALVLVDGVERSLNEVSVEDIESFNVLKDASATAVYGQRGANGVVLITTKRGTEGKVNINFKATYGHNTLSRMPEYVDGIGYANMVNEARMSRFEDPLYSPQDIEIIRSGLDPDLYPNVDWRDIILKDGASNYRAALSISGGGSTARYYISGTYYNENGMYESNNVLNKYNTNAKHEQYNYRANVDVNVTKTTIVKMGVSGYLINDTKPGTSTGDIWGTLTRTTPLTVPRMYSNGLTPSYGDGNTMNPEVAITRTGYETIWKNKVEANVALEQDLAFVTPGLKFSGMFAFDTYNFNNIKRKKKPELYRAERLRDGNGDLVMKRVVDASPMTQEFETAGDRRYYMEARLDYEKIFGEDHRISGLLMYYQQEKATTANVGTNVATGIPFRNLAVSGRATYGYKDRYLAEFNFGYTGSENFEKGKQFGFFPAIAAGWVISEESFVKENLPWLSMFKVRYSYGEVGNDKIGGDTRFPYMSYIGTNDSKYTWGEYGSNSIPGYRMTTVGAANLTWEVAKKNNLGFDLNILNGKFTGTVDFFKDRRDDIYMQRSQMPYSTGLQDLRPWANVGKMQSKGMDGNVAYSDKLGKVNFTLRANMTYAKTNIIDNDEADNALYYQMSKGYRHEQTRGWIALGLFKDQDDIDSSPVQEFGGQAVLPGDIKYKDVNGDGKINNDDKVPMGFSKKPGLQYGMGLSLAWNNFDFNILFQGSGKSDFFIGGSGVYPFTDGAAGNILAKVANPADRWISSDISGDPATENPNASFPRLTYGKNENNYRESTFWLKDGKYVRLKNLEFGYTLPKEFLRKFYMESARVSFVGYNLLVFSAFDWWDPESGSSDGGNYPIQKTCSFSLSVNF